MCDRIIHLVLQCLLVVFVSQVVAKASNQAEYGPISLTQELYHMDTMCIKGNHYRRISSAVSIMGATLLQSPKQI